MTAPQPADLLAIIPEIGLTVLAIVIMVYDLLWQKNQKRNLGFLTAGGLTIIAILLLVLGMPGDEPTSAFGGMVRHDMAAVIFQTIFLVAAAITAILSIDVEKLREGEYFAILCITTLGMSLMASATDLIMIYVAMETTSISAYILVGYLQHDDQSTEAGIKYFLFGAFASTILLYGFSLLYGYSNTTNIYGIAEFLRSSTLDGPVTVSVVLITVGLGFKVAAVPFHFWTPDVYQGAPTPITAFISVASKSAGFALLMRFFMAGTAGIVSAANEWVPMLTAMAVGTMTLGNLLAIWQTNIKRFLAYSSIAHAGYVLMAVVTLSGNGMSAAIFYLGVYTLTNLAAFGIIILFSNLTGSDEIQDYAGFSRRSPYLALAMMFAFLSLAGIPPLGGFFGKFFIFRAAVEANLAWLAIVGVLNSIIGLYYYLMFIRVMYLLRSEPEVEAISIPVPRAYAVGIGLCVAGIIFLGIYATPLYEWASQAAIWLF
ncbi:MAG: NADH-quinone oxidoreductase subunit N [Anaerolineales bacterium]|nr:NADH-quinone oxidoreductase subunit N [Anaerolineales bacterium]